MIKVFIHKTLDAAPHIPLLMPNLGESSAKNELFRGQAFKYLTEPIVEIAENPDQSDFILLPHNYQSAKNNPAYWSDFIKFSKNSGKPLIIFAVGDKDEKINVPNSIIFKYSMYKSSQGKNEIKMPTYVEDLALYKPVGFRRKGARPIVGFCGWGDYADLQNRLKSYLKYFAIDARKLLFLNPELEVRKKGIYFRKKALKNLSDSELIGTNFIIRKSHSAHKKTIELSPEQAREEYINNIAESDFSLAVRGDANESMRFYEILSLGRIPILIDTDIVLPLESEIDYDEFILRIHYKDIGKADKIISEFYKNLTEEKFLNMQKKAREAFEKYLRTDAFLKFIFVDSQRLKIYAGQ
jgi:hypothetical protein